MKRNKFRVPTLIVVLILSVSSLAQKTLLLVSYLVCANVVFLVYSTVFFLVYSA